MFRNNLKALDKIEALNNEALSIHDSKFLKDNKMLIERFKTSQDPHDLIEIYSRLCNAGSIFYPKELARYYTLTEKMKMETYSMIVPTNENLDVIQLEFIDDFIITEVCEDYIKITIKDVLPCFDEFTAKNELKSYWTSIMKFAFNGVEHKYNRLLCVINVCAKAAYWDVDNRARKIIIDSLRHNRLIPDDRIKYLTCILEGEYDWHNPRTEIYLMECPAVKLWYIKAAKLLQNISSKRC